MNLEVTIMLLKLQKFINRFFQSTLWTSLRFRVAAALYPKTPPHQSEPDNGVMQKDLTMKLPKNILEALEEKLEVKIPDEIISLLKMAKEKKEVELIVADGSYKLMNAFLSGSSSDSYEDLFYVSNSLGNAQLYPEDDGFVKIPFARSLDGDQFKYLYLISRKNEEVQSVVFQRDLDSPRTGRIAISNNIAFLLGNVKEYDEKIVISSFTKYSEIKIFTSIPDNFSCSENRSGVGVTKNAQFEEGFTCEMYLHNYRFEDASENFSEIEVQLLIDHGENRINCSFSFQIDKYDLSYNFVNNINYRIYYHKYICLILTIDKLFEQLKKGGYEKLDALVSYVDSVELNNVCSKNFVGVEETFVD